MFDELKQHISHQGFGGFLPGMKQIANVAALPGIVGVSVYSMSCMSSSLTSSNCRPLYTVSFTYSTPSHLTDREGEGGREGEAGGGRKRGREEGGEG